MCRAFSCIVGSDKIVTWKLGVDSHTELLKLTTHKDNTANPAKITFARVEITPENQDYLNPSNWVLKIDQAIKPAWWGNSYATEAFAAHKAWLVGLEGFLIRKPVINPLVLPVLEVTKKHIQQLKEWASVWASVRDSVWDSVWASVWDSVGTSVGDSVRDSVWASVGASVGDSVRDSVGDSVRDSVWASVGASVRDSVGAYTGSFFKLPTWRRIKHAPGTYPFQAAVSLWESGLVPSFDGKHWRLHAGPKAKVVYRIEKNDLATK